jgi:hypothetical protein
MRHLLILNDPPYGARRSYNGLRLANALAKHDDASVRAFLMGDAVACAIGGQKTPTVTATSNACSEPPPAAAPRSPAAAAAWTRAASTTDASRTRAPLLTR